MSCLHVYYLCAYFVCVFVCMLCVCVFVCCALYLFHAFVFVQLEKDAIEITSVSAYWNCRANTELFGAHSETAAVVRAR